VFWKLANFTLALTTCSSAAMAQSAVTVEQIGNVDPDKSMIGFKLPSKELTITSSPSGANITLIYSKGKFLSFKPVDGSKIVRCTTPCKYKLPQTSSFIIKAAMSGYQGEFAGKVPEWTGGLVGWLLRPNAVQFYFKPITADQAENEVIIGGAGSGIVYAPFTGEKLKPTVVGNPQLEGAPSAPPPPAPTVLAPATISNPAQPALNSPSKPMLRSDEIADKAMYRCEAMGYVRGTSGFRKCAQQQIDLITKSGQ
jgi:hypothetical protein